MASDHRSPHEPPCAEDGGLLLMRALAAPGPIDTPTALVVCHPDDETIALGGSLARFLDLTLVHLTDGAPLDEAPLRAQGIASRDDYARIRQAELDAALSAACVRPTRHLRYSLPDGALAESHEGLVQRLAADMLSVHAVLTHPYEGGHIDHDACARAVHAAARWLRERTGNAPPLLEFACYYRHHGEVRGGKFWHDPSCPELALALSPAGRRRREAAFACFTSQEYNLRYFPLDEERVRVAPRYDFAGPPPPAA
jgi:N-acetylglucosamine malate deacetylase 2